MNYKIKTYGLTEKCIGLLPTIIEDNNFMHAQNILKKFYTMGNKINISHFKGIKPLISHYNAIKPEIRLQISLPHLHILKLRNVHLKSHKLQ